VGKNFNIGDWFAWLNFEGGAGIVLSMRHNLLESIQWEIPADRQSNRLRAVKRVLSHNRLADKAARHK